MSIEIVKTLDSARALAWLQGHVLGHLRPDVSNYARGRLRVWLGVEPSLTSPTKISPGLETPERYLDRLRELVGFDFDYCLVTYSGDGEKGIGIGAHRDASYADYEAWGWNLAGECRFSYWEERESFGYSRPVRTLTPSRDAATDTLVLTGGEVLRFNCKNQHAAEPAPERWNLNFWKKKG